MAVSRKTVREWINQDNPITDNNKEDSKHTREHKWDTERNQQNKYGAYASSESVNG
jgi:hypothetical protein